MKNKKEKNKAFTLIELMVAIAIIGILAAIVLMQMQGYAKDARASKVLAQASSAIPSMVSCWGNGGDVASGTNICSVITGAANYGAWPTFPADYAIDDGDGKSDWTSASSWFFSVVSDSDHDDVTICCNSKMNSCGQPATCSATQTW